MIAKLLRSLSDVERPDSFANRMRNRRFQRFEDLVSRLQGSISILDIGGTVEFWKQRGWVNRDDVRITLVNIKQETSEYKNVVSLVGDATNLVDFADESVDIVFSNSVIEHLFSKEWQLAMAKEVMRVGRNYWVQTPNWWFPVEPHFQMLGWQWLPRSVRVQILMKWQCGRRGPCATPEEAQLLVDEIRLLTRNELRSLFPGAQIVPERIGGLVKSWIVHSSFKPQPAEKATM